MTSQSVSTTRPQVVLCLAGHIDHGKSSLVRALTGGTVDRLPEEQRRGMTIELGFAHFDAGDVRFSFIDVPGHERFVHTMLAGASGVDLALLVVAADDSVMPQTREHLALLELLGVPRGVIAITKCDLVDDEQLELVHLEVAELVESTFLAQAPVVDVSTRTSRGVAELQQQLLAAVHPLPPRASEDARFRLPIDRVFSPSGQGTVVTGTVWRGSARVGDVLHLLPSGAQVRVRKLQAQGAEVDQIAAGERGAINLVGIKATAIHRGDELATPGSVEPARRHLVQLRCLPDAGFSLKHREFVRVHLGATQATAQILMAEKEVAPGESAFAVVRSATPIVAEYGQPFVIRQLSPVTTIGGGTIISPALRPVDKLVRCLAAANGLAQSDLQKRLAAYVELRREADFDEAIESRLGMNRQQCQAVSQQLVQQRMIVRIDGPSPKFVAAARFELLQQVMIERLKSELEQRKPVRQLPVPVIISAMSHEASPAVLDAVLQSLMTQGEFLRRGDLIAPRVGAQLSNRQRKILDELLAECTAAGPAPPTLKDFATRQNCSLRDLEPLVGVAIEEGRLERLSPDFAIDSAAIEKLRVTLAEYFRTHPTVTTSEIREHWGITRKHAVPILEYFDARQITTRQGDVRAPGPRLK